MAKAKEHIEQKKILKLSDEKIAMSVDYPLRTYVVNELSRTGSTYYNDDMLKRCVTQFYEYGPELNQKQTEQLLDAHYWTFLAPLEERLDFRKVIQFYERRGRRAKLKYPYTASGRDVGRSVSKEDGQLRFHAAESLAKDVVTTTVHSRLPSIHLSRDLNGDVIASKIHPRKEVAKVRLPNSRPRKPSTRKTNQKTRESKIDQPIAIVNDFLNKSLKASETTSCKKRRIRKKKEEKINTIKKKKNKKSTNFTQEMDKTELIDSELDAEIFNDKQLEIISLIRQQYQDGEIDQEQKERLLTQVDQMPI